MRTNNKVYVLHYISIVDYKSDNNFQLFECLRRNPIIIINEYSNFAFGIFCLLSISDNFFLMFQSFFFYKCYIIYPFFQNLAHTAYSIYHINIFIFWKLA